MVGAIGGAAVRHVLWRLGGRRFVSARPGAREKAARLPPRCKMAMVGLPCVFSLIALTLLLAPSAPQAILLSALEFLAHLFDAGVALPFPDYCAAANATQIIADGTGSGQDVRRARRRLAAAADPTDPAAATGVCAGRPRPAAAPRRRRRTLRMPAAWRGYGDDADSVASSVAKLTNDEKVRLIQGVGWSGWTLAPGFYVGSAFAVPRLGIPSQNMQDAAQGFRTSERRTVGQVTSWPCALAVASTWDRALTREWAAAIAREFKTKGAP